MWCDATTRIRTRSPSWGGWQEQPRAVFRAPGRYHEFDYLRKKACGTAAGSDRTSQAWVAPMTIREKRVSIPPYMLSRKILCSAYAPARIDKFDWTQFRGWHAIAMLRTIARHLQLGFRLLGIEKTGPGFRIDLVFLGPSGRTRATEVKSAREIREVHRLQSALYARAGANADEITISNGQRDEILTPEFIQQVSDLADATLKLLDTDPATARTRFTPHPDICPFCSNTECPYRSSIRTTLTTARN